MINFCDLMVIWQDLNPGPALNYQDGLCQTEVLPKSMVRKWQSEFEHAFDFRGYGASTIPPVLDS